MTQNEIYRELDIYRGVRKQKTILQIFTGIWIIASCLLSLAWGIGTGFGMGMVLTLLLAMICCLGLFIRNVTLAILDYYGWEKKND